MVKNGYGSLPLHVILQRNTKMDSTTKEHLAYALVEANAEALVVEGGVGKRTPLHIAFTDYISPALACYMIQVGRRATTMKDKKGWLPIHVACSRHCSPEKLQMLLDASPSSLHELTKDGQSLLSLAMSTATKSHPNFALIRKLKEELHKAGVSTAGITTCSMVVTTPRVKTKKVAKQPTRSKKRRQIQPNDDAAADLLIHFHNANVSHQSPSCIEEV